jgi:hypothetical protein
MRRDRTERGLVRFRRAARAPGLRGLLIPWHGKHQVDRRQRDTATTPRSRLTSWTQTSANGSSTHLLGYDAFGNKYDAGISGCGSPAAGVMHCWQSSVLKPEVNAATNYFAEMTYDADGNVVRHGTYDYLYDGTSMMTGMSTGSRGVPLHLHGRRRTDRHVRRRDAAMELEAARRRRQTATRIHLQRRHPRLRKLELGERLHLPR